MTLESPHDAKPATGAKDQAKLSHPISLPSQTSTVRKYVDCIVLLVQLCAALYRVYHSAQAGSGTISVIVSSYSNKDSTLNSKNRKSSADILRYLVNMTTLYTLPYIRATPNGS